MIENVTDDEIESLETSHDTFLSEDRAWGDNLSLWRNKYMTVSDSWWTKATINTAQFSPFISKTFNDGSYLRAGGGILWGIFPVLSMILITKIEMNIA